MAENKKSFVLYCDLIHTINKLPDDYAGKVFKHLLSYVNDEDPQTDDIVVQIAFEPIKQQLKRDLSKWDNIREKRSIAGKKSAEARRLKLKDLTSVEGVEQDSTNQTVTVTVNDSVTVNIKEKQFNEFWELYDKKIDKENCKSKFMKLNKTDIEKIFETLPKFLNSIKDKQYIPYPTTYINKKRWNDEIIEVKKPKPQFVC